MTEVEEKKKYKVLENVLTHINQKYISFSEDIKKRNNEILKQLLDALISKMREKDTLFKAMYFTTFFGGSFYDGLRVGAPDEFDLDLLMTLPKILTIDLIVGDIPGFVNVKIKNLLDLFKQSALAERFKGLDRLVDNQHYLDNSKVRQWMERVVTLSINDFPVQNGSHVIKLPKGTFLAKVCKAGPAFTLKVNGKVGNDNVVLDIDLVPCFRFAQDKWPSSPFKKNPSQSKVYNRPRQHRHNKYYANRTLRPYILTYNNKRPYFFIVPKPQKGGTLLGNHHWRLSFQEQERELIDKKQYLKPSVKFLKKMRDTCQHSCIASYYIKTVALWEKDRKPQEFWSSSLSYVFMTLLKSYYECIKSGDIKYYWNPQNNLIKGTSAVTMSNVENRLKAIITDIDRHLTDDPTVVAKYILSPQELIAFKMSYMKL